MSDIDNKNNADDVDVTEDHGWDSDSNDVLATNADGESSDIG